MSTATVDQQLAQAMRAAQAGEEAEAQRLLREVIARNPDQPMARNALGTAALSTGDAVAAAGHFEAAIRGDPNAPALWINLAKARRLLGDDDGERAALEGALAIDQTHLMALIRLAELHERRGESGPAVERWSGVVALSAGFSDAPDDLRQVFAHARDYVAEKNRRLSGAIAEGLSADLAASSPRDRRRMEAAAAHMLGQRAIYANHCHGLHYPFLPADEYFDREHFPWLAELEAETATIRDEVQALLSSPGDAGLSPYVAMPKGTPANKWSVLDHSTDWSALHLWKDGIRIEEACARAPRTAAIVERLALGGIPGRTPTVFFSILKAGKHIPAHTGVTNTRAIVHLPLIVPGDCYFRVGGETREWREGEAFAFDDTIEHEAWNRSGKDRAILILDCWNPHLSADERAMIQRLFAIADAQRER